MDQRCELVAESHTAATLVEAILTSLDGYRRHIFTKRRQAQFLKDKKLNLEESEVIIKMDFAENYSFVVQDEVQSHYYNRDQCSVFTVVAYYRAYGRLQVRSFCGFTDDRLHDVPPVLAAMKHIIGRLETKTSFETVHYMTDGGPQHFKNRFMLWVVAKYEKIFRNAPVGIFMPAITAKARVTPLGPL